MVIPPGPRTNGGHPADEHPVLAELDGPVGWITLNRPAKRNALNRPMRAALDQALADLVGNDDIRVAVRTGAGTAFGAGADLTDGSVASARAEPAGSPPSDAADRHPMAERAGPVAQSLSAFGKPVIAAVNGPAVGGGLELALACDLRIAARGATFALPEVRIGSMPGSGGTQRLPRAVGPALAARMLFTGEPISAEDALRGGLISDLAEPDKLRELAAGLAGKIAANAPLSLRAVKQCLIVATQAPLTAGLEFERAMWMLLATTTDRREGRAAFRERRAPRFTGS